MIEPAAGATRTTFAFLIDGYPEETVNDETRVVMKLQHRRAPSTLAAGSISSDFFDRGRTAIL